MAFRAQPPPEQPCRDAHGVPLSGSLRHFSDEPKKVIDKVCAMIDEKNTTNGHGSLCRTGQHCGGWLLSAT
ncbi:hypothetical protein [Lentzea flava]|uniref:hypothetical protein n=1 Tax=Lentzea flava TaxID=103732 RepID=UPI0016700A03|nr:hypothetical protein [Lentzea flava]